MATDTIRVKKQVRIQKALKRAESTVRPSSVLSNLKVTDGVVLAGQTQKLTNPEFNKSYKKRRGGTKYSPLFDSIASRLVASGFTQDDLGWGLNVNPSTVTLWKKRHPSFKRAIEEGKVGQRKRLVAKSFTAAAGYRYQTSKTKTIYDKDGGIVKTEQTLFDNEQPPNHNLIMFVLTNISRQLGDDEWMTKRIVDVNEQRTIIKIDGKEEFDKISTFAGKYFSESDEERSKKRKKIESKVADAVKAT